VAAIPAVVYFGAALLLNRRQAAIGLAQDEVLAVHVGRRVVDALVISHGKDGAPARLSAEDAHLVGRCAQLRVRDWAPGFTFRAPGGRAAGEGQRGRDLGGRDPVTFDAVTPVPLRLTVALREILSP